MHQPAPGATSTTLSVDQLNFSANPIVISTQNGKANISYASSSPVILTAGDVTITNLTFQQITGYLNPAIRVLFDAKYTLLDLKSPPPSTMIDTTIFLRIQ